MLIYPSFFFSFSEEHKVCHCTVFYEIREKYHCLFKQGFWLTMQGNGIWEPTVARTQKAHGEAIEGQQYSHIRSSTKNNHNFH